MPIPAHLLALNEPQRLQAMEKLEVATALSEPIFQELVAAVAQLYRLPIAFISTVGAEQTIFLATHGVPGLRALPREASLCALPISQHHTLAFNDLLTADENPHQQTAAMLGLAAYMGAPIFLENDLAVGAFCISSPVPREFSQLEKQTLEAVAELVSQAILVRYASLHHEEGQRWQLMQQLIRHAVESLQGLADHLSRDQPSSPPSEALLAAVRARLGSLRAQTNQ